ncbi:hypothetical protein VMCG_02550 [Cytospora schulzeri]|uniref:Uncharacterized protein n=1 Tax=Cytospora schulzeri TaxID=448051 RepID=A0A423X1T2_9PEZI|nr:hypothetical protein VMCG_02550 [Valsa malicola]
MEPFIKKRKRESDPLDNADEPPKGRVQVEDDESTEVKLAILSSLYPDFSHEALLDVLLEHDGKFATSRPPNDDGARSPKKTKLMSRKGATLHLFDPEDIEEHTPCSIIHNFLPSDVANGLLREMLEEAKSFERNTFKLFDNVVSSPHTSSFYVDSFDEIQRQKCEYLYNGTRITDVRKITPQLDKVKPLVQEAVNREIQRRIKSHYPGGTKLKHQSPQPWSPNAAFVNCYNGPAESVGWHSDQLTYLGPRAVIGSLSLGVSREFRIAIHLPHNSLLVMHAEMQETWKHSVAPAQAIDPHPVAGNRRINVTYRDYKAGLHPRYTPRCRCGVPTVLRVVQKKRENWGRYFWMCHAGNAPGKDNCSFFQWAEFDDDGNPIWNDKKSSDGKSCEGQAAAS